MRTSLVALLPFTVMAGLLGELPLGFKRAEAETAPPLAVVVAKNSPVNQLSLYELKHLYLGDHVNGPDGKRLIPLNRALGSPERVALDASVLGMSPDQETAYWIDRRIRGQSGSPRAIPQADLAQRIVGHLEGGITYVRFDEVRPDVKVLRIDSKLPTDPGYRVH
ncbi:MAG TPA: hypothetical protein VFH68_25375 [Polyangia bacterium]|nr:hypothetical protein [Polyangia bacterium]